MASLIIIGCGGHGRIVLETVHAEGVHRVIGFADDDPKLAGSSLLGLPVFGPWSQQPRGTFVVAVGNNEVRRKIHEGVLAGGHDLARVISPKAHVSAHAELGMGSVVLAGAVIQSGARVGQNVIINAGAVVDHDAGIGDHAHVGPNATVASFGRVQAGEFLEAGMVRLKSGQPG